MNMPTASTAGVSEVQNACATWLQRTAPPNTLPCASSTRNSSRPIPPRALTSRVPGSCVWHGDSNTCWTTCPIKTGLPSGTNSSPTSGKPVTTATTARNARCCPKTRSTYNNCSEATESRPPPNSKDTATSITTAESRCHPPT